MPKKFKDDKYKIIHRDLDKIKARPTMYVSALGEAGVLHLCKEIIDNNRDEVTKAESPGNEIFIDIADKYLMTRDNGRGIPTDILREVLETLQAGSNMTRTGGATSGENGVGSSCVLALSSVYEVMTIRPQEKKKLTLRYQDAELVDEKLEDYDGNDHGLFVKFTPSKKIMGTDKIPVEDLVKWIHDFDYTLPRSVNLTYKVRGKQYRVNHKWLREFFDIDIPKDQRMSDIVTGTFTGEMDEVLEGTPMHRTFEVEVAIMYASGDYHGDDIRQSWMNMIHTPQNGSHVDAVLRAFTNFIQGECANKNKKLMNEDIRKDVLSHLQLVVKAQCNVAHMFSAQSKHAVLNNDLRKAIEAACFEWLKKQPSGTFSSLIEAVLGNHRARIAGEQARDISKATRVKKQWTTTDKYIPCSSIKTDMPKELFLVEGDSAGGGLNGARFPFQAILKSRGKNLNAYELDPVKVLNSDSWKNLIPILGCGVGSTFDLKKLKFDKVIIATDADIDGYHIRTEHLVFFKRFLPQIIEAGKLYIAEPPLYQLTRGKDVSYVATQTEYIQACIDSIGDLHIGFPTKDPNEIKEFDIREFVSEAFDYLNILRKCSIQRSVNRYLLEHIAWGFVEYGHANDLIDHIDEWLRHVAPIYKEIGFNHDTNQVTATIDLIDQFVLIDEDLEKALFDIINIQKKYGILIRYSSTSLRAANQSELSHFFEFIEDRYPNITGRYKGLGSSDADVLRSVVMDPRTRRLIRVTADDVMTMEKMGALVGKGKDNILQRKEMLMNFKFTAADIDN